mgnify:CR=1 FL=1
MRTDAMETLYWGRRLCLQSAGFAQTASSLLRVARTCSPRSSPLAGWAKRPWRRSLSPPTTSCTSDRALEVSASMSAMCDSRLWHASWMLAWTVASVCGFLRPWPDIWGEFSKASGGADRGAGRPPLLLSGARPGPAQRRQHGRAGASRAHTRVAGVWTA